MTDVTAQAFREAAASFKHDWHAQQLLLAAAEQREQADARDETQTMQLAAIMTASIQNTPSTRQERIARDHPYWSVAYSDVCVAIDREIALREQLDAAEAVLATHNRDFVITELEQQIATLTAENEALKAGIRGDLGGGNSLPDFWTPERQLPYVAQRLNKVEAQLRAVIAERDELAGRIANALL
jgi:hypothetical protein